MYHDFQKPQNVMMFCTAGYVRDLYSQEMLENDPGWR